MGFATLLDIPQPLLLVSVILSVAFFSISCHRNRVFHSFSWDFNAFMRILMTALGLGFSIGWAGIPALWFAFSYPITGGTVEENLPPGIDPNVLVGIILAGAIALIGWSLKSFFDVLK